MYSKSSSAQVISTMLEGVTEIRASYSWTGVIAPSEQWQGNPIYIANSSVNKLLFDAIAQAGCQISFYGSHNGTDLSEQIVAPIDLSSSWLRDRDTSITLLQFPYVIPVIYNGSEVNLTSLQLAAHLQ